MQQTDVPPTGYKFVEYAESDGSAFVQLPFGFNNTDEVITRFAITKTSDRMSDKYIVSPNVWNNNRNRYAMGIHSYYTYSNLYTIGYGSLVTTSTYMIPQTVSDFQMHTWTYKDLLFYIPELDIGENVASVAFGGVTRPLRLFFGYNSNTAGKIAFYNHKHDGMWHRIVPIQKVQDGTVEMYDTVSKTIMPRTGTLLAPS